MMELIQDHVYRTSSGYLFLAALNDKDDVFLFLIPHEDAPMLDPETRRFLAFLRIKSLDNRWFFLHPRDEKGYARGDYAAKKASITSRPVDFDVDLGQLEHIGLSNRVADLNIDFLEIMKDMEW
jgi:hypothetical protein